MSGEATVVRLGLHDAGPVPLRSATGAALIVATVLASMTGFLDASVVNVARPEPFVCAEAPLIVPLPEVMTAVTVTFASATGLPWASRS